MDAILITLSLVAWPIMLVIGMVVVQLVSSIILHEPIKDTMFYWFCEKHIWS